MIYQLKLMIKHIGFFHNTLSMTAFVKANHLDPYKALDPALPSVSARGKSVFGDKASLMLHKQLDQKLTNFQRRIRNWKSIAEAFTLAKASRIAITGRTESKLKETVAELGKRYLDTKFSYVAADITDVTEVKFMFNAFGTPDILVGLVLP